MSVCRAHSAWLSWRFVSPSGAVSVMSHLGAPDCRNGNIEKEDGYRGTRTTEYVLVMPTTIVNDAPGGAITLVWRRLAESENVVSAQCGGDQ